MLCSAIRIDNVRGEKVGHLPRDVVTHVSAPAPVLPFCAQWQQTSCCIPAGHVLLESGIRDRAWQCSFLAALLSELSLSPVRHCAVASLRLPAMHTQEPLASAQDVLLLMLEASMVA